MILKLENTTTHQIYEYEVKDMNNGEKLYFRFDINTSDLVDGEYTLKLYDGDKIIATDILKIGDFNANALQYKKGENIYIEVKLNESVQDVKNVSISTIETSVLPDDGFNSMGKVDVNAQPLYDNAYHIGHTEGYNEGLESSYQVGYDDGYSVGNEDGYNSGYNVGNEDGFNNGVATQKSKLEAITITENGTYTKEDGYNSIEVNVPDLNGSYDEGYSDGYLMGEDKGYDKGYTDGIEEGTSNAGEIIAQTAQVINITENGSYLTKYSDPYIPTDITGYFDDGTPFYGSAELVNIVFYTDIIGTADSYFEVWWKDLQNYSLDHSTIVGLEQNGCIFKVSKRSSGRDSFAAQYGASSWNLKEYGFNYNMSDWTHIKFSREGLYINGERMDFDFQFNFTNPNSAKFQINDVENGRYANGVFGMVKIDGRTFIPTEEGFKNYSTGEMLEFYKEGVGSYKYIINDPIYGEGNLIKTVNVNVIPKINPNDYNLAFGKSSFTSLPEWVEWEKITNYENLFYNCQQLKDISLIKKINGTSLSYTFQGCNLIKGDDIKHLDISNVTSMRYTFYQAGLDYFPSLDTSNVTDFNYCFASCNQLKYVEPIDTSKATDFSQMFYDFSAVKALERLPEFDCTNVVSINQYFCYDSYKDRMDNLTDVGGWKNLKIDWTSYGLNVCRNLSYQSCINVLNGLWDFRGNGDETTTRTLKVHQNFLDAVGDEISIGVAKGWVISA